MGAPRGSVNDPTTPFVGNFDAIETAKEAGAAVIHAMQNTGLAFGQMDNRPLERVGRDVEFLPPQGRFADRAKASPFETLAYRFLMNNTPNSLGRVLMAALPANQHALEASCAIRAQLEADRILLASRLYQDAHSGSLPSNLSDLVPTYLPAVPRDPFSGSHMLFNAHREIAYSVGANLSDDGGDIGSQRDIGVSLTTK